MKNDRPTAETVIEHAIVCQLGGGIGDIGHTRVELRETILAELSKAGFSIIENRILNQMSDDLDSATRTSPIAAGAQ